jgi:peptide/nickel transport system substrate-binding protein
MLTDYVSGSSLTYVRNPNYWMHDPLHPENQLPYIDNLKQLIITDLSTAYSALRTGKVDYMDTVLYDDAQPLFNQRPQLQSTKTYALPLLVCMRVDKPELPFYDIRVRQALNMAVNKQAIVDDYFSGHAALLGFPYPPDKTHEKIYTPLDQQPQDVQDLFKYDPDRARQLLSDAGFPTGFSCTIDCTDTQIDELSIVREDLLKVGVDMKLNQMEVNLFRSFGRARGNKEMIGKGSVDSEFPWRMLMERAENADCCSFVDSPVFRAAYEKCAQYVGKDDNVVNQTLKEVAVYDLQQAWAIWLPDNEIFTIWWPWIQNFQGEVEMGYFNRGVWPKYTWVDPELKRSMGY